MYTRLASLALIFLIGCSPRIRWIQRERPAASVSDVVSPSAATQTEDLAPPPPDEPLPPTPNVARFSEEELKIKLHRLFPRFERTTTVPELGRELYGDLQYLVISFFSFFAKARSNVDRNADMASMSQFHAAVSALCRDDRWIIGYVYPGMTGGCDDAGEPADIAHCREGIFAEDGVLVRGELQPQDPVVWLALKAARNAWLYPYAADSPEVAVLVDTFKQTLVSNDASETGEPDPVIAARQAVCIAAYEAPQFWFGNPKPGDVIRRFALSIGGRVPQMQEIVDYEQGTLTKDAFIARLLDEPGFVSSARAWHRTWLQTVDQTQQVATQQLYAYEPRLMPGLGASAVASHARATWTRKSLTAEDGSTIEDAIVLTWIDGYYNQNVYSLTNSEQCSDFVQEFDPSVDRIEWQESYTDAADAPIDSKTWVTVPPEKITANIIRGNEVHFCRDLTEDEIAAGRYWGFYSWCNDPADWDRTIEIVPFGGNGQGNQRILRYPQSNPSVPQNGYSRVRVYWTNEPVYVCNALARYWLTCNFRPTPEQVPSVDKMLRGWLESNNPDPLERSAATQSVGLGWGSDSGNVIGWIMNSIATKPRLDAFSCGVPDLDNGVFPKEPPYQDLLTNYHSALWGVDNPSEALTERQALATVQQDLTLETDRLIGEILRTKADYRELLTADWTMASGPTELMIRSGGFALPQYPPATPDLRLPGSADYLAVRRVRPSEFPPIPRRWFENAWGSYYGMASYPIDEHVVTQMDDLRPRPLSGILTQRSFYGPAVDSGKVRTIAAKIYRTLTCGELNAYVPQNPALHDPFILNDGGDHLDKTRGCYGCHVNMDPLAAALTPSFLEDGTLSGAGYSWMKPPPSEVWWQYLGTYAGTPAKASKGALFDQPVRGIRDVGSLLADSPQFAQCVAQQTFQGIFGRALDATDLAAAKPAVKAFMSHHRYDLLVRDLVLSSPYWLEE